VKAKEGQGIFWMALGYNGEPIWGSSGIPYGQHVPNGIIFHDFRRMVKTNMLNAGFDKVHRNIIVGHSLHGRF
jgi:hypothetical protein